MSELKNEPFVWQERVYYEHTDAGGVVYHARYLNIFERARTEHLRAMGIDQAELKQKHNLIWIVLDMNIEFLQAAKLDDELLVTSQISWVKGVRRGFHQEMSRKSDGVMVAKADLTAAMLYADSLKPARVPAWIKAELDDAE